MAVPLGAELVELGVLPPPPPVEAGGFVVGAAAPGIHWE